MKIKGFVLLEVCIALLVLSILSSSIYPLFKLYQRYRYKEHLEKLTYALSSFVEKNNRLPCPGDREEVYPCEANIAHSVLPYKTLEIPKEWIYTLSGKPIVYKVNFLLTRKNMKMDYRMKENPYQLLNDSQTFCYTPLTYGNLETSDHIPMAFQLDQSFYPRDVFLQFYVKHHCQKYEK